MQQIVREHQTYPPKIVASVTSWELWKTLKGKDLTDQCDWVELRVDALPPELTAEQVLSLIHIRRCRRSTLWRSRWAPAP